ncbi:unnamed protein product [Peniophora sp. CBMAI 1063]|nr:unnamed protein product [Peniophora sp. CBMAI 1063]
MSGRDESRDPGSPPSSQHGPTPMSPPADDNPWASTTHSDHPVSPVPDVPQWPTSPPMRQLSPVNFSLPPFSSLFSAATQGRAHNSARRSLSPEPVGHPDDQGSGPKRPRMSTPSYLQAQFSSSTAPKLRSTLLPNRKPHVPGFLLAQQELERQHMNGLKEYQMAAGSYGGGVALPARLNVFPDPQINSTAVPLGRPAAAPVTERSEDGDDDEEMLEAERRSRRAEKQPQTNPATGPEPSTSRTSFDSGGAGSTRKRAASPDLEKPEDRRPAPPQQSAGSPAEPPASNTEPARKRTASPDVEKPEDRRPAPQQPAGSPAEPRGSPVFGSSSSTHQETAVALFHEVRTNSNDLALMRADMNLIAINLRGARAPSNAQPGPSLPDDDTTSATHAREAKLDRWATAAGFKTARRVRSRGKDKNRLARDVREMTFGLCGRATRTCPFARPPPSEDAVLNFYRTGRGGPTRETFMFATSPSKVKNMWNIKCGEIVAECLRNDEGTDYSEEDSDAIQAAFDTYLITLNKHLNDRGFVGGPATEPRCRWTKKQAQTARRNGRRETTGESRLLALELSDLPADVVDNYKKVGLDGGSDDESDHEGQSNTFAIKELMWQSSQMRTLSRCLDLKNLSLKFKEDGTARPGNWPRRRIPSQRPRPAFTVESAGEIFKGAIQGLPKNWYDQMWLHALAPPLYEALRVGPEVEIELPQPFIMEVARYIHLAVPTLPDSPAERARRSAFSEQAEAQEQLMYWLRTGRAQQADSGLA